MMEEETSPVYENTNGVPMANGKNLHMDLGVGDIANRVINVGSHSRAAKIASLFDNYPDNVICIESSRGFTTYTGKYKGVDVSVVAIGMGTPMMDFFVRETRAVVTGPMMMIRYGTCGGISSKPSAGSVVVVEKSGLVLRNYNSFKNGKLSGEPYMILDSVNATSKISEQLQKDMVNTLGDSVPVHVGTNVTADSFYGSQGRIDDRFLDDNKDLINKVQKFYKNDAKSMEMETFQLLHLASCSNDEHPIYTGAAAIVVADRQTSEVISDTMLDFREIEGGRAVLNTLVTVSFDDLKPTDRFN